MAEPISIFGVVIVVRENYSGSTVNKRHNRLSTVATAVFESSSRYVRVVERGANTAPIAGKDQVYKESAEGAPQGIQRVGALTSRCESPIPSYRTSLCSSSQHGATCEIMKFSQQFGVREEAHTTLVSEPPFIYIPSVYIPSWPSVTLSQFHAERGQTNSIWALHNLSDHEVQPDARN